MLFVLYFILLSIFAQIPRRFIHETVIIGYYEHEKSMISENLCCPAIHRQSCLDQRSVNLLISTIYLSWFQDYHVYFPVSMLHFSFRFKLYNEPLVTPRGMQTRSRERCSTEHVVIRRTNRAREAHAAQVDQPTNEIIYCSADCLAACSTQICLLIL